MNIHEVKELYSDTLKNISSSEKEWQRYLDTTSKIYRYPFDEQILIYAQNPNATAVASMNIWNEKMGCFIKKGSRGIALIDRENKYSTGLKYVFDVNQVRQLPNIGRLPYIWEMRPEYERQVIEDLEQIYGSTDNTKSFAKRVVEIAERVVKDTAADNNEDIAILSDDFNHEDVLELAKNSVSYMLLRRCGIDTKTFNFNFHKITNIQQSNVLSGICQITSSIANSILHQIGLSIVQKSKEQNRQNKRTIQIIPDTEPEKETQYERPFYIRRRAENDIGLHTERRISDTKPESEPGAGRGVEQVRKDVLELSGRTAPADIQSHIHDGANATGVLDNTAGSERVLGDTDSTVAGRRGPDRADEEHRPTLLDSENEQYTAESRRDSNIRNNYESQQEDSLQGIINEQEQIMQTELFPTTSEQIGTALIFSPENRKTFIDLKTNDISEDIIKDILRSGTNNKHSREHIYAQYLYGNSPEVIMEFIKNEYRNFAKGFTFDDMNVSLATDDDGIKGGTGNSAFDEPIIDLSWSNIESIIRKLVEAGDYIDYLTAESVLDIEREDLAYSISYYVRDLDYRTDLFDNIFTYPEITNKISDMLSSKEGISKIREEIAHLSELIKTGQVSVPYKYLINGDNIILNKLDDLAKDPVMLSANRDVSPVKMESFITQDEINNELRRGSSFTGGKQRIYNYFLEKHTISEKVAFLKNEYGIGGHYAFGEVNGSYDSKGIKLEKNQFEDGDELNVILRWTDVAKRITDLIAADKYLLSSEKLIEIHKINTSEFIFEGNKHNCNVIDTWDNKDENGNILESYTLGQDIEDESWYYVQVNINYGEPKYSDRTFEFDHKPSRDEVQSNTVDSISAEEIDRHEAITQSWPGDIIESEQLLNEHESEQSEEVFSCNNGFYIYVQNAEDGSYDYTIYDHYFSVIDGGQLDGFLSKRELAEDSAKNLNTKLIENTLEPSELLEQVEQAENSGLHIVEQDNGFSAYNGNVLLGWYNTYESAQQRIKGVQEAIDRENEMDEAFSKFLRGEDKPHNFHITDPDLGNGTPKEKFRRNIEAIKTLKLIEMFNRVATPDEQKILSQYVGWGGLSDAFDESKSSWSSEFAELKSLLSESEYEAAKRSTLNSHYTQPDIISGIYETLKQIGFKTGNILEPSMGVGNFFGMLPAEFSKSKLYGIELDSISGRIAQLLYPEANIEVNGFEDTKYPDNFFDVAIGNVPFGDYKVYDKTYNKLKFMIHDYFFAKTLDKVRPGGVIAFITSMGTMDKKNENVRKYLAERAELLGAIRLPNNAFSKNAGADGVTSDIIFLKKRDQARSIDEDWIHIGTDSNGLDINAYFAKHPEMILGHMEMISGPFGMKAACIEDENTALKDSLYKALINIKGEIGILLDNSDLDFGIEQNSLDETLPADPSVSNYSYTVIDDKVYYREDSVMVPINQPSKESRLKALISVRDSVHDLINKQLEDYPENEIVQSRNTLNKVYDECVQQYGRLASQANQSVFINDSSAFLLASLELYDNGKFVGKADIFSKRTIKRVEEIHAENPSQALAASLNEKGYIDLDYMSELINMDKDKITSELTGVIFKDPATEEWLTSDAYLSGNVRQKLEIAQKAAEQNPEFTVNVKRLEEVQPKELDASEIDVRLGSTWVDKKYILDFMQEILNTPYYRIGRSINVEFSSDTGIWNITGKNLDTFNIDVKETYGTDRINAYQLLENCLNLKETVIKDRIDTPDGPRYVVNKRETVLATQKQDALKEAFKDWIFKAPGRRHDLVEKYNILFNSIHPREYDGSHLTFPGMASDVTLRNHQKNAVAHIIYGNNTLLAHCVGAGKTWEMATAAMEMKRIGICSKSLFVVPSHLTEQWGRDFLQLYPSANILVATKKDFEPANRKKFCARIATGNYDAVIIGHSQFEKIPLSKERQEAMIQKQIDEIEESIAEAKFNDGSRFTVKQMEKSRKTLETRLKALTDSKKDDVVTFEELGIDRLFVDESHYYKNLYLYTKMTRVAGIQTTEAQKSQDMYMKCQYMDELTGGKGITFATGTPVSNSMQELYTNMRYLQAETLKEKGLSQFDAWASTFGECTTNMEISPTGTDFRAKTRFSNFFNLPELMSMFKESADIKTADDLELPVPEVEYENVQLERSEYQDEIMQQISNRTDAIKAGIVDPSEDNMLKITNDGKKLALDQRLINPLLPDSPQSKTTVCVEKAFEIYQNTSDTRSTQVIFCDKSVPTYDGSFNVYDDIKQKLITKGVPENEIAFIHDCKGNRQKEQDLFTKVNKGDVRFILGSTDKMGAGTNMQHKLIALHHLDCPWRPSDLEQREGRIVRQGNENYSLHRPVKIFRYVTKDTFDAYSWQIIENKQKFISQIMTSKSPVRGYQDIDEEQISAAIVKALCTGNPYLSEKMNLDVDVAKLKIAKANYQAQQYRLQDNINTIYPRTIANFTNRINNLTNDIATWKESKPDKENFNILIKGINYSDTKEAGVALIKTVQDNCIGKHGQEQPIGQFANFSLAAHYDALDNKFYLSIKGASEHSIELSDSGFGNLIRIQNALDGMSNELSNVDHCLEDAKNNLLHAKEQLGKPFAKEEELNTKIERLAELDQMFAEKEEGEESLDSDEQQIDEDNPTEKESLINKLHNKKSLVEKNDSVPKELSANRHSFAGIGDEAYE